MTTLNKLARNIAAAAVLSATAFHLQAQDAIGEFIQLGQADGKTIINAYASPMLKSFGSSLNAGWFQTAKPHGIGGFDITVSGNLAFAPTADQTFDARTLQLQKVTIPSNQNVTSSSTIFGPRKNGQAFEVRGENPFNPGTDTAYIKGNLFEGIGVNFIPLPSVQFSVGVGFGTEVAIRFMPPINAGGFKANLLGFAVKHDFKQWIPGMKVLPFDLSAMFAYNSVDLGYDFGEILKPSSDTNVYNSNRNKKYDDQGMELTSRGWTANILVSKKLGPFTPYLGVGYQTATTTMSVLGTYPISTPNDVNKATDPLDPSFGKPLKNTEIKDPLTISNTIGGMRATVGFRLKLLVLTIHGDYTFAEYNVASVGLGINLQSIVPFKL